MPKRIWIVDKDKTDHGGTVIASGHSTTIMGYAIARVGDKVWCPRCKTVTTIINGEQTFIDDGKPVAYEGCYTSCGAQLISVKQNVGYFDDGTGIATSVAAETPLAAALAPEKKGICLECLANAAKRASAVLGR